MNALGAYLLISLSFVIGTMIEFAVVLFIKRQVDRRKTSSLGQPSRAARICSMKIQALQAMEVEYLKRNTKADMEAYTFTDKIDFVAFSFFNISFIMFNIIYFIIFVCWLSRYNWMHCELDTDNIISTFNVIVTIFQNKRC